MAKRLLFLLLAFVSLTRCSGSDDKYDSVCGTVIDRELFNPISEEFGEPVTIEDSLEGNLVVVRNTEDEVYFIQLQGIAPLTTPRKIEDVKEYIFSIGSDAFLFIASSRRFEEQGDREFLLAGQLFSNPGISIAEELLLEGLVRAATEEDDSGSELVLNCLQGLDASANISRSS